MDCPVCSRPLIFDDGAWFDLVGYCPRCRRNYQDGRAIGPEPDGGDEPEKEGDQ